MELTLPYLADSVNQPRKKSCQIELYINRLATLLQGGIKAYKKPYKRGITPTTLAYKKPYKVHLYAILSP